MCQIQFLSGDTVFQSKTLVKATVLKRKKILLGNIVISKQHEQAVFIIIERKQPEDIAVDILNSGKTSVFPQLIPIPQFNITKRMLIIVILSSKIEMLVF